LPALIFNIAQALRLKGDAERALRYYREFIQLAPSDFLAGDARAFAAALEQELAQRREAAQGESRQDSATKGSPSGESTAIPLADTSAPDHLPEQAEPSPASGRALRIAGLTSAGVGLALGAGAIVFGLEARANFNALRQHNEGPWTDELLDRQRAGKRDEGIAIACAVGGAAAVVSGGILYWLGQRERVADGDGDRSSGMGSISLHPALDSRSLVIALDGRF
jgi:hypothetical protein